MAYGLEIRNASGALVFGVDDSSLLFAEMFFVPGTGVYNFTMARSDYSEIIIIPIGRHAGSTVTYSIAGTNLQVTSAITISGGIPFKCRILCMR